MAHFPWLSSFTAELRSHVGRNHIFLKTCRPTFPAPKHMGRLQHNEIYRALFRNLLENVADDFSKKNHPQICLPKLKENKNPKKTLLRQSKKMEAFSQ